MAGPPAGAGGDATEASVPPVQARPAWCTADAAASAIRARRSERPTGQRGAGRGGQWASLLDQGQVPQTG